MTIVDMHCHILPGVDDGPATMEESIATLREAQRQGIQAMIVTPHFHPGRYKVKSEIVRRALDQVRSRIARENLSIRLVPGQECYYYSGLLDDLESGNVLTMAGTRFVLVEFDVETMYTTMQRAVWELGRSGYTPIIAHFERYQCLYNKPEKLRELQDRGAMLQMNFDRLNDKDSFFRPNPWRGLLKQGYVDFLGSDTHGMAFRPLHVGKAVDWLMKNVDQELRDRILVRNIGLLIDSEAQF